MRWRIAWFSLVTLRSSLARFSLFKLRKTRFYKEVTNNENYAILTFHTIREIYVDFLKKIDWLKLQQGIKKNSISTLPLITVYFKEIINTTVICRHFSLFFISHLNLYFYKLQVLLHASSKNLFNLFKSNFTFSHGSKIHCYYLQKIHLLKVSAVITMVFTIWMGSIVYLLYS